MTRNLILKYGISILGICKQFQTPRTVWVLGLVISSISEQDLGAHSFLMHGAVTQEGVSACSGRVSGLRGLVIKTSVYTGVKFWVTVAGDWLDHTRPKITVCVQGQGLWDKDSALDCPTTTTVFLILLQQVRKQKGRQREKPHWWPVGRRGGNGHITACNVKENELESVTLVNTR